MTDFGDEEIAGTAAATKRSALLRRLEVCHRIIDQNKTQKEIAAEDEVSEMAISKVVKSAVKHGLVQRGKKRGHLLWTEQGQETYRELLESTKGGEDESTGETH